MTARGGTPQGTLPRVLAHPVIATGLKVQSERFRLWSYRGCADVLVNAGLVRSEWLPGRAGCPNKTMFSIYIDGRRLTATRVGRDQYNVDLAFTRKEHTAILQNKYSPANLAALQELDAAHVAAECPEGPTGGKFAPGEDDWPPPVRHNPAIRVGDGSKWHYLASPEAIELAGLLDPEEIPGHPRCASKWYSVRTIEDAGVVMQAVRLNGNIAVTLLSKTTNLIRSRPVEFRPR